MKLIDGKALATKTKNNLQKRIAKLKTQGVVPGLVVILVGDDQASQIYVRGKERDAKELGFYSIIDQVEDSISQEELITKVENYNRDPKIHGILVQLPLPKQIDQQKVLLAISPEKDVDGFHPVNIGQLLLGNPQMIPCTPFGIMRMFTEYGVNLEGKNAVVIGRSNIVGKPMAILLTQYNATVTLTHSKTRNLPEIARTADVLVVAIGVPQMITADYVKDQAVVIDVGMNYDMQGKLVGDVDFADVAPQVSLITPVPGGVGPMTRAMLMEQTVIATEKIQQKV